MIRRCSVWYWRGALLNSGRLPLGWRRRKMALHDHRVGHAGGDEERRWALKLVVMRAPSLRVESVCAGGLRRVYWYCMRVKLRRRCRGWKTVGAAGRRAGGQKQARHFNPSTTVRVLYSIDTAVLRYIVLYLNLREENQLRDRKSNAQFRGGRLLCCTLLLSRSAVLVW